MACGRKHRIHQESTRRFTVRSSNRMRIQFCKRILVENLCGFKTGGLHVSHLNPLRSQTFGSNRLAHHSHGTRGNRILRKFIGLFIGQREE